METFFRTWLEGFLLTATWADQVREEMGLGGVSQVWGDHPAWYLWLADAPGAYQLTLAGAEEAASGVEGCLRAVFTIKYFPSPDEGVFQTFSAQERELVTSGGFDQTNAPTFETARDMDAALFDLAVMETAVGPEQGWAAFSLEALSCCRMVGQDNGSVLRRAPGWGLALPLFQRLAAMFIFSARMLPSRVAHMREKGFEQVAGPGSGLSTRACGQSSLETLCLLMCPNPASPPDEGQALINREILQNPFGVVFDHVFTCAHYHGLGGKAVHERLVFPAWWSLASADHKSSLASSCGCEH